MYSGLPWHNIRLILTKKSFSAAVIEKRIWLHLPRNFGFRSSILRRMLSFHYDTFVVSWVLFVLAWDDLISSFYPLQFWWGPECLLSGIAKGNPHKPHKSLKKADGRTEQISVQAGSVLPLRSAATGVDRSPAKRHRTAQQPAGSACSPGLKGQPHPEHFVCICSILRHLFAGISRATSSLWCFCNLQIKGDRNVVWRTGHDIGLCSLRLARYLPFCSIWRANWFLNYHYFVLRSVSNGLIKKMCFCGVKNTSTFSPEYNNFLSYCFYTAI